MQSVGASDAVCTSTVCEGFCNVPIFHIFIVKSYGVESWCVESIFGEILQLNNKKGEIRVYASLGEYKIILLLFYKVLLSKMKKYHPQ